MSRPTIPREQPRDYGSPTRGYQQCEAVAQHDELRCAVETLTSIRETIERHEYAPLLVDAFAMGDLKPGS